MIKKAIALGLITGSIAIAIIMHVLKPVPEKLQMPQASVAVKIQHVEKVDVPLTIESQGTITAKTRTLLTSEVSGSILEVSDRFISGGIFSRGDTLMQIDTSDYDVALQRAEAQLISRQAALEFEKARAYQAKKEWAMTGKAESEAPPLALRKPFLSEAKALVLQAEAELKQSKLKLSRTTIRAPYDGMVSQKLADIGQYLTPGTPLGEIFSIDVAEVRLPLTEKDLSMMSNLNQKSKIIDHEILLEGSINGSKGQWIAKLHRFEGEVNEVSRSQFVVANIADPYHLNSSSGTSIPLLVGTFVRAFIPGRIVKNIYKVPRSSLIENAIVGTVDETDHLRLTEVDILFSDDQFFYVESGLSDGDRLIVSALGTPIEGIKLEIKNTPELKSSR